MFQLLGFVALLAAFVWGQDPYTTAEDSNNQRIPNYSPARPPAIPLAVRSPYTSIWSSTAGNSTLNSGSPVFWDGTAGGWSGIITVDGISYEWLGVGFQTLPVLDNLKEAQPLSVAYDSQYSNFTFQAGNVELTASFFSPVVPKDLCRSSIPLSYLQTSFHSTDGAAHDVQLYSDVNAYWMAPETNKTVNWTLVQGHTPINGSGNATAGGNTLYSWIYSLSNQYTFGEESDLPLWGNFTYTTSPGSAMNFSFQSGSSMDVRYNFINKHYLNDEVDAVFRAPASREPVFAFAHDFGPSTSGSVLNTIGAAQVPIMRYLTTAGIQSLLPWWTKCYGDIFQTIAFHYNDFATSQVLGAQFESQLKADVDAYYSANAAMVYSNSTPSPPPVWSNGTDSMIDTDQYGNQYIFDPDNAYGFLNPLNWSGIAVPDVQEAEAYYSIVALSARQVMGAYVLAIPPAGEDQSEPLMFQKEISSDGNVNTIDVVYPAMPFFLYANPNMLRYTLNPLYYNQENNFYPNGYSMHDLGSNFPNATGHVEGNDEYMPVEESGNMIIMTYAYYKFTGDASYLAQHFTKMQQWTSYLIQFSLIPNNQLSTDDFAGELVNQTNLAIKGIVALGCMSNVAQIVGNSTAYLNYSLTSRDYYEQWEVYAVDPSQKHTLLAYEWRSSYGLLYNTYPDLLLDLGIVGQRIFEIQSLWYPTISQVFGVPLDSRHSYTKSDWEMWTAATCQPSTRRLFVNGLAYWLNSTSTDLAFTDLYETIDSGSYPVSPSPIYFIARPVAGGHYSLLALLRGQQLGIGSGSIIANGTATLTAVSAFSSPTAGYNSTSG